MSRVRSSSSGEDTLKKRAYCNPTTDYATSCHVYARGLTVQAKPSLQIQRLEEQHSDTAGGEVETVTVSPFKGLPVVSREIWGLSWRFSNNFAPPFSTREPSASPSQRSSSNHILAASTHTRRTKAGAMSENRRSRIRSERSPSERSFGLAAPNARPKSCVRAHSNHVSTFKHLHNAATITCRKFSMASLILRRFIPRGSVRVLSIPLSIAILLMNR